MSELKLVINAKDGKSYSKIVDSSILMGRKINDTFKGDLISLTGYELKITGGSDLSGFPMRPEINLAGKKKIYAKKGIGIKPYYKGNFMRKTMAGNTIYEKTAQLNLVVTQQGKKALNDLLGKKEEAKTKKEETTQEKPLAEKKEVKEEKKELKQEQKEEKLKKLETGEQTETKN